MSGIRHVQLEKIGKLTQGRVFPKDDLIQGRGHVVYARINLKTRDMYVGETSQWHMRVKAHFMNTLRHSKAAPRCCQRCDEHQKYKIQGRIGPCAWIMIPIGLCENKVEGRRLERWAIRKWRPNINRIGGANFGSMRAKLIGPIGKCDRVIVRDVVG